MGTEPIVIPPWSHSTISSYKTCPLKYFAAKVSKKYPDQQNEASLWGNRVHTALENRVLKKTPLPEGMKEYEPLAALFDAPDGQLIVEKKLALDKYFRPAEWDKCWVRGIIDIGILKSKSAKVYDWKTGKPKRDSQQLALFAALVMGYYPYIETVKTGFIWLKDQSLDEAVYTREDLPGIWEEFIIDVRKWENSYKTGKWEVRPSGLCRQYCSNMECSYNGRRNG